MSQIEGIRVRFKIPKPTKKKTQSITEIKIISINTNGLGDKITILEVVAETYEVHIIPITETTNLPQIVKAYCKWISKERKEKTGKCVVIAE